ncbi:MAG: ArsC/Spx/MgsR family protein [Candidatus Thiodiazotropha sp. 6PLUC2]
MTELVFYEKPGCVGNQQQKAILRKLGITLEVRDILSEPWTHESLRPFFENKPVSSWFNDSAPQVKSGEIKIDQLDEIAALELMIGNPILIKRPLMICQSLRQSGFTPGTVLDKLGVTIEGKKDLQSCPMETTEQQVCEAPP